MNAKPLLALRISLVLALAAVMFSIPQPVLAASCQWIGSTDTDWHKSGNWTNCNSTVPGASDTATIPDATNEPVISSAVTIAGLTVNSGSSVTIGGSATLTLTGNVTNNGAIAGSGTFRTQGTVRLFQYGTFSAPFQVFAGTTTANGAFGGAINISAGATLRVAWTDTLTANNRVWVAGTLSGEDSASTFIFNGGEFFNDGAVAVAWTKFTGSGAQSIDHTIGLGTWTGLHLNIESPSNTSLAKDVTFEVANIQVSGGGTVSGSNEFQTKGTVRLLQYGTFSAPLHVVTGTTTASGAFGNNIWVDSGATLRVAWSDTLTANGEVTVSGTLSGEDSASIFLFKAATFTNNGSVTVPRFHFGGSSQTLTGSGNFSSNTAYILNGSMVALNSNHQMSSVLIYYGGTLNISSRTLSLSGAGTALTNWGTFTTTGSTIVYNGSAAQMVTTDSVIYNNLTIDNTAGATLDGNEQVGGMLYLKLGDLKTSSYTLTMGGTGVQATGSYDVIGNVSRAAFDTTTNLTFGSPNTFLLFSYTIAPTNVTVTLVKEPPGGMTYYVKRKYTISIADGTNVSANLRLHFQSPTDLVGIAVPANIALWRHNGSRWVLQGKDSYAINALDSYVQKNGVSAFSDWALSDNGEPTAVMLSSFSARSQSSDMPLRTVLGGIGVLTLMVFGTVLLSISKPWRRNLTR